MKIVPEHSVHYVELVTSDADKLRAALAKAHGWNFVQEPDLGGAWVAEMPGGGRCGIRAPMHDQEKPVTRTYLRVADLDAAVKAAAENGALIALPSMDLGKHGRIAIYILGGIEQGLWQVVAD